jgi:hypothetical protein
MGPRSSLEITEDQIQAIAQIVSEFPRELDPSGKPYKGVFHNELRTVFYKSFRDIAVNPRCSFDKPCGSCKREIFEKAAEIAEERRLISSKAWPPKSKKDAGGKLVLWKHGYKKYYRPDEIRKGSAYDPESLDRILSKL